MKTLLAGGLVGALLAYFLDPTHGNQRRNNAMQKVGSSGGNPISKVTGMMQGSMPHQPDNPNPDDKTLTDRVESEIFSDTETSRENININVVNGIVTVRGELPNQGEIDDLVKRIQSIPNVKGVQNFLHLPGTPAPNKVDSLRVSP